MDNIQAPASLSFDAVLTSLLLNKEPQTDDVNVNSIMDAENLDSFGSWYEAD